MTTPLLFLALLKIVKHTVDQASTILKTVCASESLTRAFVEVNVLACESTSKEGFSEGRDRGTENK